MEVQSADRLRRTLRQLMKAEGIGAKPLAKRVGLGETAVRDIIEGNSLNPRIGTLSAIADYFNVTVTYLLGGGDVAVVGKIGAGGSVAFEEVGDFGFVPQPPDTAGELVGLEVEGDSMLPKFDPGDVIYINREQNGVSENLIGAYCACRLVTGETYLKILSRGSRPGVFTLRSLNAADMEDRELEWATPVRAILPRFARGF